MKKNIRSFFLIALFASVVFSCKKKDTVSPATNSSSSTPDDYVAIDNNLRSADESIAQAGSASSNQRVAASGCFDITWEASTSNPSIPGFGTDYTKFTLNFSGSNCDSLVRSGKIIVYQSGSYLTQNYKDSVVFSGYTTNGQTLNGYKVSALSASSASGTLTGSFLVNILATSGNKSLQFHSEGQKTISNYLTPLLATTETTGSGKLVDQNGNVISVEITKPIVRKSACLLLSRFPVEGTINYNNTIKGNTAVIDYGNGDCDKKATIAVNGNAATTFTMK